MHAAEALVVAAGTLFLVIVRPRGLNEGIAALLGAAVVLLLGLVSLSAGLRLEWGEWNIFLFFLGMMGVAALADQSGVFDWVSFVVARLARRRVAALYAAVFCLGGLISLFFANDSTALVLTPIVYALVVRLALDPLPFVFATTFVADSASVGLPVSNPLNVILADHFHLTLGSYVAHLWLPALLVFLINLAGFFLLFRRSLAGRFDALPSPPPAIGLTSTLALLCVLAVAYLVASALAFSVGAVAVAGAVLLALNLLRLGVLDVTRLGGEISWPIFGFIGGMALVVQALATSGVTEQLGRLLGHAGGATPLAAIAVTTVGTALGANVINNLPMAYVMWHTIGPLHLAPGTRSALVYSSVLGCDLGPNLTHLGSLATFIWLFFLRRKGLDVSAWDYFRIGAQITPFLLVGAILGLWLTSG